MNHFQASEQHKFVEKGKEWRDIAMEKVMNVNSKYIPINPPSQIPMLSNTWTPEDVKIEKINLSRSESTQKFCYVLHNVLSKEECQHLIGLSEHRGKYELAKENTNTKIPEIFESKLSDNYYCSFDDIHVAEQIWQRVLKGSAEKDRKLHYDLIHVPWVNERNENLQQHQYFQAVGLNEQMRILRCGPGNTSECPHEDRPHVRASEAGIERYGEQSLISFQLFLNDDFKEGGTRFLSDEGTAQKAAGRVEQGTDYGAAVHKKARLSDSACLVDHTVMPRTGSVLLFQHNTMHQQRCMVRTAYGKSMQYRLHSEVLYSTQGPGSEYANRPIIARQFDDLY